ncbi:hypothetical protein CF327_g5309 [Tilletia walkeri]|nr:hypothetical protein CF327_g5309 [Tilletia walkeri]
MPPSSSPPSSEAPTQTQNDTSGATQGRVRTAVDVRNHYRSLKGMWKEAKELIDMSGFGWDEDRKKVTAEEEVWNDLIKRRPEFKKWKAKSFPLYPRLDALNAKVTTGGRAVSGDGGGGGGTKVGLMGEDGLVSEMRWLIGWEGGSRCRAGAVVQMSRWVGEEAKAAWAGSRSKVERRERDGVR